MKTKIMLSMVAVIATTCFLIEQPLAITEKSPPLLHGVAVPLNLECIVSIENEAWMQNSGLQRPGPASGFLPDYTIQGKLVHLDSEWVVISEGTYDNWISRSKVVNIRASR